MKYILKMALSIITFIASIPFSLLIFLLSIVLFPFDFFVFKLSGIGKINKKYRFMETFFNSFHLFLKIKRYDITYHQAKNTWLEAYFVTYEEKVVVFIPLDLAKIAFDESKGVFMTDDFEDIVPLFAFVERILEEFNESFEEYYLCDRPKNYRMRILKQDGKMIEEERKIIHFGEITSRIHQKNRDA